MILLLKGILLILCLACFPLSYFVFKEARKYFSGNEFEESSLYERFVVYVITFVSIIFFLSISVTSALLFISKITVSLPW